MWIGRRAEKNSKWSTYRDSYWTDFVVKVDNLIENLDNGGLGKSGHQDYTPVLHLILHRWNDD